MVFRYAAEHIPIDFCGSQDAVIGCGSRNAPGVHQGHCRHLSLARFGPFPVGEVPGIVPDGQAIVVGGIPCPEAGSAEGGLYHGSGSHQISQQALFIRSMYTGREDGYTFRANSPLPMDRPRRRAAASATLE